MSCRHSRGGTRSRIDDVCYRFLLFLAAACLLASIYIGWPVLITWIATWWGLRLVSQVLDDSSRR